ncbi:MAG: MaoC family dehydratase N-terminal domain-containing protein [Candidatus Tectomicrobia bacterium]|nr:MaoC family dehydratase N-terminal domain-containing protein [Candidatus Tectomicrobia bacterium]
MAEQESVADQYRHLIGTEHVFTAPEEVGRASIRKFALAIGDMNPLYVNRTEAAKSSYGDVVAPPTLVCETTQYYQGRVDDAGGFTDRMQLPEGQTIRAGNEYVFHRLLRPDDVITARWIVRDVYEKSGRTGALLFVVIEITYTNQHGALLAENHETLAYRLSRPETEETPV